MNFEGYTEELRLYNRTIKIVPLEIDTLGIRLESQEVIAYMTYEDCGQLVKDHSGRKPTPFLIENRYSSHHFTIDRIEPHQDPVYTGWVKVYIGIIPIVMVGVENRKR